MEKNLGLIAVLIISIILITGCTNDKGYKQPSKVTQSTPTTESSQLEKPSASVKEEKSVVQIYCDVGGCDMLNRCVECYEEGNTIYDGIKKEGISYCNRFSDYRNSVCFYLTAMSEEDVSLCDKISISSKKNFCIAMVAIVKKDVSLCEKITKPIDDKNGCILWVAEAKELDHNSKTAGVEIETPLITSLQHKGYSITSLKVHTDEDEITTTCSYDQPEGTCTGKKKVYVINVGVILSDDLEDTEITKCWDDIISVLYAEYPQFYRYNVDVKSNGKEFKSDMEKTDIERYWDWKITRKELYKEGGVVTKGFKETGMDKIHTALGSCDMDVVYVNTGKLRLFAPKLSTKKVMDCMKKAVRSLYEIYPETEEARIIVKINRGRTTTLYLTQGKGENIEKIISEESDGYHVGITCYDGDPVYGGHGRCYDSDILAELNAVWYS